MPVKSKYSVLQLEVSVDTPTTEEWTAKWGAQSLLTEATNNVWYRSTAAEARDLFLHGSDEEKDPTTGKVTKPAVKGIDDITGIPRRTIQVTLQSKDANGKAKTSERWDPDDSEQKYFNRVCGTLVEQKKFPTIEAARTSFLPLLQTAVNSVPFDASKAAATERKAKAIPAKVLEYVNGVFVKKKETQLAKLLSKAVGHPVEPTVEGLAKAIIEDQQMQAAKRQAEFAAMTA